MPIGPAVRQAIDGAANAARRTGTAVVDTVYPKRCAGCRERGAWVCAACLERTPRFTDPVCPGCGLPGQTGSGPCRCDALGAGLRAVRSVGPFTGWLRQAVLDFKYHDEWARAGHLGRELAPLVAGMATVETLVPVPLHRARLRQRGYNQSALLAHAVGELGGWRVAEALIRTRPTAQQTTLSAAARASNVEGAFAIAEGQHLTGLHVVLVDDVITTGSTLSACARTLAEHGAASVRAVTLARQL